VIWLAKPVGLDGGPVAIDHFLNRFIRVWTEPELLEEYLGGQGREWRFLGLAMVHQTDGMFFIQHLSERV
jgi:hypothetical protein